MGDKKQITQEKWDHYKPSTRYNKLLKHQKNPHLGLLDKVNFDPDEVIEANRRYKQKKLVEEPTEKPKKSERTTQSVQPPDLTDEFRSLHQQYEQVEARCHKALTEMHEMFHHLKLQTNAMELRYQKEIAILRGQIEAQKQSSGSNHRYNTRSKA
jgi:hypothetical protein